MSKPCYKCGFEIRETAKFCSKCGANQALAPKVTATFCSECGAACTANDLFCAECGFSLVEDTLPSPKKDATPQASAVKDAFAETDEWDNAFAATDAAVSADVWSDALVGFRAIEEKDVFADFIYNKTPRGEIIITKLQNEYAVEVEVPEGATVIADGAFERSRVISVTLPDTVTTIGKRAFAGCVNLKTVKLPVELLLIDDEAFADCPKAELTPWEPLPIRTSRESAFLPYRQLQIWNSQFR